MWLMFSIKAFYQGQNSHRDTERKFQLCLGIVSIYLAHRYQRDEEGSAAGASTIISPLSRVRPHSWPEEVFKQV